MVQGKTVSVIVLLISLLISIFSLVYAYCFLELNVNDWIALGSLLLLGWIFMLSGLGEILKVLRKPKLKIAGFDIITKGKGSEGEYKEIYFFVRNDGGEEARDCELEVKVKDFWRDFYTVPWTKDIYPDKRESVFLCAVTKSAGSVAIRGRKTPPLDRGKIYTLEIKFYGRNLDGRKIHRLKLDLSSWENIGITLDC